MMTTTMPVFGSSLISSQLTTTNIPTKITQLISPRDTEVAALLPLASTDLIEALSKQKISSPALHQLICHNQAGPIVRNYLINHLDDNQVDEELLILIVSYSDQQELKQLIHQIEHAKITSHIIAIAFSNLEDDDATYRFLAHKIRTEKLIPDIIVVLIQAADSEVLNLIIAALGDNITNNSICTAIICNPYSTKTMLKTIAQNPHTSTMALAMIIDQMSNPEIDAEVLLAVLNNHNTDHNILEFFLTKQLAIIDLAEDLHNTSPSFLIRSNICFSANSKQNEALIRHHNSGRFQTTITNGRVYLWCTQTATMQYVMLEQGAISGSIKAITAPNSNFAAIIDTIKNYTDPGAIRLSPEEIKMITTQAGYTVKITPEIVQVLKTKINTNKSLGPLLSQVLGKIGIKLEQPPIPISSSSGLTSSSPGEAPEQ